jgi:glycosyltransferase involved in cell wall biosynthesis
MSSILKEMGDSLIVLGTESPQGKKYVEGELGRQIIWLNEPNDIWQMREQFKDVSLVVHTGWNHWGWRKFDKWIKKRGGKVVVAVDNRFKKNLRQFIGAIWFRLYLRRIFDAAFVPGASGLRLMKFLGFTKDQVFTGLYGAYEKIYKSITPFHQKQNEFLYVGQFIKRKGLDQLIKSFQCYRRLGGTWGLRLIGSGPLLIIADEPGITVEPFSDPDHCSRAMDEAKCFILPSRDDHWGTVVCEAAATGAILLVSSKAGVSEDMVIHEVNGYIITSLNSFEIAQSMLKIQMWSAERQEIASKKSIELSTRYSSISYQENLKMIMKYLFS